MSKLSLVNGIPATYNRASWVDIVSKLEMQVNSLTEGRASAYHGSATAAPTSGSWVRGDWVKNSAPSPTDYFGWVCTTTGTPGTWKGFGLIQA